MPVFDIFSKRQKRVRCEVPDVYSYDTIARELRIQIAHIWNDAFGEANHSRDLTALKHIKEAYVAVVNILIREYGVFRLSDERDLNARDTLVDFLLSTQDVEKVLDVIELSFRCIDIIVRDTTYQGYVSPPLKPDDAIEELNDRFREHGIGYQYESGELIRVDSQIVHGEIVKPALMLLSGQEYQGANEEYLKAHEHYRHGNYKECLNECLKAFESTMKAICDKRAWAYNPNDTARKLIDVCFQNGLILQCLQSEFTALRTSLESGVPTVRNKLGGHGQGSQQTVVPPYLASYLLHLTATNILLLVNAEKDLP